VYDKAIEQCVAASTAIVLFQQISPRHVKVHFRVTGNCWKNWIIWKWYTI